MKRILVTGGAGFIGSNLVDALLAYPKIALVRVLDNLSNGHYHNISHLESNPRFEFIKGDIRDYKTCIRACSDIDLISHQAALGSVPRSIKDPISTNNVNISGTLNIFHAGMICKVNRIVFAASSSTYGDHEGLPKMEEKIGEPLSPYAITKYVNELYAQVFAKSYSNFNFIGLRYFNVFGPRQDPRGAYAAVIPLFFKAAIVGDSPTINGDGSISRDFTFVENAVEANLKALFTERDNAVNQIYNVACGQRTTLKELWQTICEVTGHNLEAIYGPERIGDIQHSLADISKAKEYLDYQAAITVSDGLRISYDWYKKEKA